MSETAPPNRSDHDRMVDEVIFKRDLDEVHLLLDYVSGRTDKSLADLKIADDADPDGKKMLSTRAIVERITQIRYPPDSRNTGKNAQDAAFLLVVKDQLNGLADPARGLTVAYTAMFVGVSSRPGLFGLWLNALLRTPEADRAARGMSLAQQVYPGLVRHADRFRHLFFFLVVIALPIWLALTALTYWDGAYGRSLMQRFDHIERQRQELVQASPALAYPDACNAPPKPELAPACAKLNALGDARTGARVDLRHFRSCDDAACNSWLHVMRWGFVLCGSGDGAEPEEQMIATVLTVYSNYILPMMFGLIGAMIAAIRKIQDQIGKSELHPRDSLLTVLLVLMGSVAALAVGLFYSPNGTGMGGGMGLSGDLTLTAGGIGFLAGYGSASFFTLLDSLLKQVFRLDKPAPKDPPAKPA